MTGVEIVAEVGSNHNGDWDTAKDLIYTAADSGADTVKFQHYPDDRYGPAVMPGEWLKDLDHVCHLAGVRFLCSVFDMRTLDEYVQECDPRRVKIASPELVHHHLLEEAALAGLGIILSTGASTPLQILEAAEAIWKVDEEADLTMLHCVSSYPVPPAELNLAAMCELGHYGWYGLSDHTADHVLAPVMATALGAVMVEKHFTLDKTQDGPDHQFSVGPDELRELVGAVRVAEAMLGDGVKRVMPSEDPLDRRTVEWTS